MSDSIVIAPAGVLLLVTQVRSVDDAIDHDDMDIASRQYTVYTIDQLYHMLNMLLLNMTCAPTACICRVPVHVHHSLHNRMDKQVLQCKAGCKVARSSDKPKARWVALTHVIAAVPVLTIEHRNLGYTNRFWTVLVDESL